jgi:hypothetical protein
MGLRVPDRPAGRAVQSDLTAGPRYAGRAHAGLLGDCGPTSQAHTGGAKGTFASARLGWAVVEWSYAIWLHP